MRNLIGVPRIASRNELVMIRGGSRGYKIHPEWINQGHFIEALDDLAKDKNGIVDQNASMLQYAIKDGKSVIIVIKRFEGKIPKIKL